ncbi:hypothetical protein [Puniceibacterium sediminis]|uniref:Uncharacterized protein n=1 Tax=Puniceibacterium sediminis TaxID=1608407 RepID=A0A238YWC9_9RHOB|nr:hypothetical protein [Puniceibacterium sediminis]SNR74903.1 hypothetical protein SAMN06265370_12039 [Puniceibacterium sediminis]
MLEFWTENHITLIAAGAVLGLLIIGVLLVRIRRDAQAMTSFEAKVDTLKAENQQFRTEFARLVNTDSNGEVPKNIAEQVRARFASDAQGTEQGLPMPALCRTASESLKSARAEPGLMFSESDAADEMHRASLVLDNISSGETPILSQLESGELDIVFRLSARHQTYQPQSTMSPVLAYAEAALKLACSREGITIWVPPLLTVQPSESVAEIQPEPQLRDSTLVRRAINRLQIPDNGVLILDCQSPGWSTRSEQRPPKVVTLDSSW